VFRKMGYGAAIAWLPVRHRGLLTLALFPLTRKRIYYAGGTLVRGAAREHPVLPCSPPWADRRVYRRLVSGAFTMFAVIISVLPRPVAMVTTLLQQPSQIRQPRRTLVAGST